MIRRRRATPKFSDVSFMSAATDLVRGIGKATVKSVTVRSQIAPQFSFDPFAETPPDAKPNWILNLVKPEITLDTVNGPIVIAPYGTPERQYGIPIAAVLGGFLIMGVFATGYFLWKAVS